MNPACSNLSILFSATCFSISLPISDISILLTRQSLLLASVLFLLVCSFLVSLLFLIFSILLVLVFPLVPSYNLLSVFLLLFCHLLVLCIALLLAHQVQLIYLFLISLELSSPNLRWSQTCLLLLFYVDLILFLGYLRLFILCLVLIFSPFLFHMFLFLLGSSIHLSYSDVSGIFVSKTFLFSLSLLFPLVLFHLHHIFSDLFFFTSFPLIFLIFFQSSFPPLSCLISSTIFSSCFLISFFISSLAFIFCSLYLSQIKFFSFS